MFVSDVGRSCATAAAVSAMTMLIPIKKATAATARTQFVRGMPVWFGLL